MNFLNLSTHEMVEHETNKDIKALLMRRSALFSNANVQTELIAF